MSLARKQTKLNVEYRVLRCKVGGTSVGLGLIGTVSIAGRTHVVFSATRDVPPDVLGLDGVGKALLAAVPESIHNDLMEVARGIRTDPLSEVAKRYSGTVFADELKDWVLKVKAGQPSKFPFQILKAVTDLFETEVLEQRRGRKLPYPSRARRRPLSTQLELSPVWTLPDIETRAVAQTA